MPPVPLPTIPGAYYVLAKGLADSQPVSNILCFERIPAAGSVAADEATSGWIATAVATRWSEQIVPMLSDHYIGGEVWCYPLGSPTSPHFVSTYTQAGTQTGTDSYRQVAALVHHTVHRRGKGTSGRTFLSPMSSSSTVASGDELEVTYQGSLQTAWDLFISRALSDMVTASGGGVGFGYRQLSKKAGGAIYPIVNSTVDLQVASIRRRHRR